MIAVFSGPTISTSDVQKALPGADVRTPARTGDIYAVCQQQASAIGLIDGFFEGVPSVWHKEILWALDQGIPVFGASSMGALRAAELHSFGMTGVGRIFEAYRDGKLEDDDEVALRHGPQELGYVAVSEPMVNIRASLDHAVAAGVVDSAVASDLTALAKATNFPDRSWETVFDQATDQGLDSDTLGNLQSWLTSGRVDQKHLDALEMLSVMARMSEDDAKAKDRSFEFQHTVMWEALTRTHRAKVPSLEMQLIFDQVRRDPNRYQDLRSRAAAGLVSAQVQDVPQSAVDHAMTRFRKDERLFTGASLNAWLTANNLGLSGLQQRFREELQLSTAISANPEAFRAALIAELKTEGSYGALLAQARKMAERLEESGFRNPALNDLGLSPATILFWFFEDLNRSSVPDDLDDYLYRNDFADRLEFEQMMARAFVLWQNQG
ncbi:TfuA-like protein [Roseovarius albus]|uniref:TfuA-like protein n=1 Tax=Roseovarius albus TaxID=1247867 RepID=A0A1X7A6Y1_9RHOB|nr:TfuA-like protein [Roseovarius albus]SLN71802.1 TfuA-like protein [Roseovarius albus]